MAPQRRAADVKAAQARNFDALNAVVGTTGFDPHLRFLNYGYAPLPGEEPVGPNLGPLFPNPDAARMLFQLVGDLDLTDRVVADVGCGRGGNLWLIGRHHQPRATIGQDVAATSVQLVAERVPGAAAILGDAERLPFADASIDVLVSVETSCAYPDLDAFLCEAARVLTPGGWLLHSDLLPAEVGRAAVEALGTEAFDVVTHRDITANVLAARSASAARQGSVFDATTAAGADGGALVAEYLGTERSGFGRSLADGSRRYRLSRLRRTDRPAPARPILDDALRARAAEGAAETAVLLAPSQPPDPDERAAR